MQHGIREFRPRQPLDRQLSSDTLNRILRELESLRITRVVNGTFKKLPGGTEIVVAPQSGGTSTPTTPQPWDIIATPDPDADPEDENPPYILRVRPGTLNGILPSNWDIEEEVAGTGLFYAKAVIATDGEAVTGVTIEIDGTPPAIQEPVEFGIETNIEYLFGLFTEGSAFRVIGNGSINASPQAWFTVSADPPAQPGESPYDIYYYLRS
jgi:hypothetical protein